MKADVLPIDSAEHQAVQMLLPWRGNELLSAAERARVEAHLPGCARCQADLAWQARLRSAMPLDLRLDEASPHSVGAPDVDRGWVALRARVLAQQPSNGRHAEGSTAADHPRVRRAPLRWWGYALAVQAALVLAISVTVFWWAMAPRTETYRALGATAPNVEANALVVFKPDATEAQMRAALRAGGARLVGGPTVTDAYLLHISSTPANDALVRLRAQPAVLRVESLDANAAHRAADKGASR